MKEFARFEWERALRSLATARQALETDPDSSVSRSYYAAFHAVTALFAMRGQTFSKHTAVRAAVHRNLAQSGLISKSVARDYDFLLELREKGDYGGPVSVSPDNARLALSKAQDLLDTIHKVCPEMDNPIQED